MEYKMLVLDLDDTLLTSQKDVTEFSLKVLQQVQIEGIKIMVATMRTYGNIRIAMEFDAVSCINGALTYINGQLVGSAGISKLQVEEVVNYLVSSFKAPTFTLAVGETAYDFGSYPFANSVRSFKNFETVEPGNLPDVSFVNKINILMDSVDTDEVIAHTPLGLITTRESSGLAVMRNPNIDKMDSVNLVAKAFDISLGEIVTFGDSDNDYAMIKSCGLGVAVGNATETIKVAADMVTGTNDEDGVAHFINNRLIKNRIIFQ